MPPDPTPLRPPEPKAAPRPPATRGAGGGAPCILVIEDDDDFRDLLVEHLAASGHRVRAAAEGAEGLEILGRASGAVALVLLDLRMPVMDGFEVCRRVERSRDLAVPIVVMTAEHETREMPACRCVVAVLHKPLELDRLDGLIEAHFRPG